MRHRCDICEFTHLLFFHLTEFVECPTVPEDKRGMRWFALKSSPEAR